MSVDLVYLVAFDQILASEFSISRRVFSHGARQGVRNEPHRANVWISVIARWLSVCPAGEQYKAHNRGSTGGKPLMKVTKSIAAVAFVATTLFAQQPQPAPPQKPAPPVEMQKLVESIDVRVINVDVVVTDRKGNVVHGLTKDDFEIYENGIPKPVSNFYEVEGSKPVNTFADVVASAPQIPAAPQPPAPARPAEIPENMKRRIIFFIDNLSLNPFNRNKVFAQMKDFIKEVMRPGDEAMIATFNRSMKVRVPFTRDTTQLIQTLDVVAGESAMGGQVRNDFQQFQSQVRDSASYDDAIASARTYSESAEHDLRQTVESINGLMTTLAGVEGKKVLVLTSEGFPLQPGKEAFFFIDDYAKEKGNGWSSGSTLLEGAGFDATSIIQSVARTANANGITMYTIHAGGLAAGSENSAENARPTSFTVSQAMISNSTDSLQLMADMTGGLASLLTNNFKGAFERIHRDLDSYYSLGYRAGTERVDRQRQLEVRVKNRNLVARARQTFVEKSTFADMSDRVVANLLYRTKANDLKILVKIDTPQSADDLFKVPIEVQIPMEAITLVPQGEEMYVGGFDVFIVVGNKDGDMSDVARKEHQFHVANKEMPNIKGKYYTYTMDLLMEPGLNKISIGVVDQISNVTGFAREQIIAKDLR
jgi:VWFA-related protein